jgi:hypothetical protein
LLAARTATACITAAMPYSTAATIAAMRLTSTAHLPRLLATWPAVDLSPWSTSPGSPQSQR